MKLKSMALALMATAFPAAAQMPAPATPQVLAQGVVDDAVALNTIWQHLQHSVADLMRDNAATHAALDQANALAAYWADYAGFPIKP